MVLTWRGMVSGLWLGLAGRRLFYFGSMALQVTVPLLVMLACAIWSKDIDRVLQRHPQFLKSLLADVCSWVFAVLVIIKIWVGAFYWAKAASSRARQYFLLWLGVTAGFVSLAILLRPLMDTDRSGHLYVLLALLAFPLARVGMAPRSLEKNRAR